MEKVSPKRLCIIIHTYVYPHMMGLDMYIEFRMHRYFNHKVKNGIFRAMFAPNFLHIHISTALKIRTQNDDNYKCSKQNDRENDFGDILHS